MKAAGNEASSAANTIAYGIVQHVEGNSCGHAAKWIPRGSIYPPKKAGRRIEKKFHANGNDKREEVFRHSCQELKVVRGFEEHISMGKS